GFAGPTQPLVPLEREHMRVILPILITRRLAPSRYRKIIGEPKELSPARPSRQSGHRAVQVGKGNQIAYPLFHLWQTWGEGCCAVVTARSNGRQGCTVTASRPKRAR